MPTSITEIFIIFFFATFFVGVAAFSSYGYMLILLLKDHSKKFNPTGPLQYFTFFVQLMFYYISRSLAGFFGYSQLTALSFYMDKDKPVRAAESEESKLKKAFTIFSSAYILFFVFLIITFVSLLYLIADQFM